MKKSKIAVMEIGSSKISVVVGEESVNKNFILKAKSTIDYAGFMKGKFLLENALANEIEKVLFDAEGILNEKIDKIYVGVPAEFCYSTINEYTVTFNVQTRIKQKNIDMLFEKTNSDVFNKTLINRASISYNLDSNIFKIAPINKQGTILKCLVSEIFASNDFINLIAQALNKYGLREYEFISENLALGINLFDDEARKEPIILIDCGYITTSVSLIEGEGLLDLKSFSIGGGQITSDLADVLNISYEQAEKLKRKLILTVQPTALDNYALNEFQVDMKTANEIAFDRIDMIVEGIKKCINKFKKSSETVYLTGAGLSYIKGIKYYLSKQIGKKIKTISAKNYQLSGFENTSKVTIMQMASILQKKC